MNEVIKGGCKTSIITAEIVVNKSLGEFNKKIEAFLISLLPEDKKYLNNFERKDYLEKELNVEIKVDQSLSIINEYLKKSIMTTTIKHSKGTTEFEFSIELERSKK